MNNITTDDYNAFVHKMNFVPQTKEYLAIALGGEVGETLNEVKKAMRPGGGDRNEAIALEIGDTLYYLTALAKYYGYTLQDIMKANIAKLEARQLATGIPSK